MSNRKLNNSEGEVNLPLGKRKYPRVPRVFVGESLTEQGPNVNGKLMNAQVVQRYLSGEAVGGMTKAPLPVQDIAGTDLSYQAAMDLVTTAHERFDALPSKVRKRFHHSPQEFMEFMSDADNVDEAIKLGLAVKRPEPSPEPEKDPQGTPPPKDD